MAYIMDGREVKIGDKLYDLVYGEGVVREVYHSVNHESYVYVNFPTVSLCNIEYGINYIFAGYNGCNRTLFWSKPEFEIPEPPKQKVKKYRVLYTTKINPDNYGISSGHYKNQEEFDKQFEWVYKFIQLIEDSMIEVEE